MALIEENYEQRLSLSAVAERLAVSPSYLSRLFRRRFLERLEQLFKAGQLQFFSALEPLREPAAFQRFVAALRKQEWVVYAKRPFAGPEAVLAYLSRYTHRVAIANSRLLGLDAHGVTFRWKDYRAKGRSRSKTLRLATDEFIRRFLLHVLPAGFHRIRHYGLFANTTRKDNLARARERLVHDKTDASLAEETNAAETTDRGNPDASAT